MTPPITELDQLKQQNGLLLKRLLLVSRERDELLKRIAALDVALKVLVAATATEAEAS